MAASLQQRLQDNKKQPKHKMISVSQRMLLLGASMLIISPLRVIGQNSTATNTATNPPLPQWSGCVDPNNPDAKVQIGKATTVCFHIGNSENWADGAFYTRVSFKPQADQYSRLHIPNSFTDMVGKPTVNSIWFNHNITVGAASQQSISFLRLYSDKTNLQVYPYLTAIIDVNKGNVRGITWDDSCVFCGKEQCKQITYNYNGVQQTQSTAGQPTEGCYVKEDQCLKLSGEGNTLCDLTVYVVWSGTDAKGVAMQSAGYRFSQFPPQELQNRVNQFLPTIPSIKNPLTGYFGRNSSSRLDL